MSKKVFVISGFIIATLFFSIAAVSLPVNAQSPDFIPGETRVVVAFGKIPGQDLYAHVWVVIPPGSDKNQIVNESLRQQGLKPFSHSEFSETGLKHPQFFDGDTFNDILLQYYNSANQPAGVSHSTLMNSQSTWTNHDHYGNFAFSIDSGLTTDRCPSLVKECKGRQVTDTFNDVAWMSLKDKNTLGVTWYTTSDPEADMALNTNFSWSTNGASGTFDVETVYLHENGHVLGLGHSDVQGSIMEAVYDGVRKELHQDDICGIQSIYGTQDEACGTSGSGSGSGSGDPEPTGTNAVTIAYQLAGGKNNDRHLLITLHVVDDSGSNVSGAEVSISISSDTSRIGWGGSASTGTDGKVTFQLSNVKNGCYTTTVNSVTFNEINWDGVQPSENTFCKS